MLVRTELDRPRRRIPESGRSRAWFGLVAALVCSGLSGCGTDAQGIEACRKIEEARCRQAPACPSLGVGSGDGVSRCVQFYRDQCLHGLGVPDPGAPTIDQCVDAINQAGHCAVSSGDPACQDLGSAVDAGSPPAPCDLLVHIESMRACSFLVSSGASTPPADAQAEVAAEASE